MMMIIIIIIIIIIILLLLLILSSIREHLTMNYDIRHNLQFQELKVFIMGANNGYSLFSA